MSVESNEADLETEIELTLSEILEALNVRLSTSVSRYATLVKVGQLLELHLNLCRVLGDRVK